MSDGFDPLWGGDDDDNDEQSEAQDSDPLPGYDGTDEADESDWFDDISQRIDDSDADERIAEVGSRAWARTKQILGQRRTQLVLGAIGAVGFGVVLTVTAGVLYGLLSGVATGVGLIGGLAAPWVYVRVMRSPAFGSTLATAFFILAQLTFGAGAVVRREDGRYEWRRLQQDDGGLYAELSVGRRVDINGDIDELPSLAWAPVAVVEERTEKSLDHIRAKPEEWTGERPDPARGVSGTIETPLGGDDGVAADGGSTDGWRINASKLERWCRGTADSEPVRAGLRKALEEEGGQQQLSELYLMIGAGVLLVFGFGMTSIAMLL